MNIPTASTRSNFNEAQTAFVERHDIDLMAFDDNVATDDLETSVLEMAGCHFLSSISQCPR